MRHSLLQVLFGCTHHNTTFPLTPLRHSRHVIAEWEARTYVACLDCGKEIPYDWDKMQRVGSSFLPGLTLAFKRITTALRARSAA